MRQVRRKLSMVLGFLGLAEDKRGDWSDLLYTP
jgi:hypothetical protein